MYDERVFCLLLLPDPARFEEATYRTTRWLDRCIKANRNPDKQNLFPIVQGGFDVQLRDTSMQQVRTTHTCCSLLLTHRTQYSIIADSAVACLAGSAPN